MDKVQEKLIEMVTKHPGCTSNRQTLKSLLADYLPANKREVNLLIAAYDEGIVEKLSANQDATLAAIRFVKLLQADCGMAPDAAFWTVGTWCHLLNQSEVAYAIADVEPPQSTYVSAQGNGQHQPAFVDVELGLGVYKAGVDFPSGEISLQVVGKKNKYEIWYGVSKNPNRIQDNQNFMDKAYVNIEDGQYLMLKTYETGAQYIIRVTKIS